MTNSVMFMTMLFPPQLLSGGCCFILAKVWVRCMALLRVMLLYVLCLGVITALCDGFLGFCPSYRGLDSLWLFGTIYASIAGSVFLVFHFPYLALSFTCGLLRCPPLGLVLCCNLLCFFFFEVKSVML